VQRTAPRAPPSHHGLRSKLSTTTDLIDGEVAAYRARGLDGYPCYFSADAVIRDANGNIFMEEELAIREFYEPQFRDSSGRRLEFSRRIECGDYVIAEEVTDGLILEGYPQKLHAEVVYRVRGSKISDATFLM